jgi:hypothetical protein
MRNSEPVTTDLRSKWVFRYKPAEVLEAAEKKAKHHTDRKRWWSEECVLAEERLKTKSLRVSRERKLARARCSDCRRSGTSPSSRSMPAENRKASREARAVRDLDSSTSVEVPATTRRRGGVEHQRPSVLRSLNKDARELTRSMMAKLRSRSSDMALAFPSGRTVPAALTPLAHANSSPGSSHWSPWISADLVWSSSFAVSARLAGTPMSFR